MKTLQHDDLSKLHMQTKKTKMKTTITSSTSYWDVHVIRGLFSVKVNSNKDILKRIFVNM